MIVLNACIQKYIINLKIQQIVSILKERQKDNQAKTGKSFSDQSIL